MIRPFRPFRCLECGHRMRLRGNACDRCHAWKLPEQSVVLWLGRGITALGALAVAGIVLLILT